MKLSRNIGTHVIYGVFRRTLIAFALRPYYIEHRTSQDAENLGPRPGHLTVGPVTYAEGATRILTLS